MRFLSFGAGVQSTTLLRMILAGEIEPVDHVIFADTGWEPRAVYEHLARMRTVCEDAGVPFHMVSAGNIRDDFLDHHNGFAAIPFHITKLNGEAAMARRLCTNQYKLRPLEAKMRELVGLKPRQRAKGLLAEVVIGISWDEVQRMKDPGVAWRRNSYPLVDRRITRAMCLEWNHARQYDLPPRSACIGCPFRSKAEWRRIKRQSDEWDEIVAFDKLLREAPLSDRFEGDAYLYSGRIPLAEADFRSQEEHGQEVLFEGFGGECEGMCGV